MGVGNLLLLAPTAETATSIPEELKAENPAMEFVECRIGPTPADGSYMMLGRTDCGMQFTCSKCGDVVCPGCGQEVVLDAVNDRTLCRACIDVDLLEYIATGAWYGRYATIDEAMAKEPELRSRDASDLERRRIANGYYDRNPR